MIVFIILFGIVFSIACFRIEKKKERLEMEQLEIAEMEEETEQLEINRREKIEILDNALIKYNRLLETLETQLQAETDHKKRAAILSKQISTLEKLNRTIEKREKLDQ